MRDWKMAVAAALVSVACMGSAQSQAPSAEVERLAELGRLWIYLDFFNPYIGTSDVDWDAALIVAVPAVRDARTKADHVAALDAMLTRSGDPSAGVIEDTPEPTSLPPPVTMQDGVAIANCSAMARAMASENVDPATYAAELAQAPSGAVVDCRDAHGPDPVLESLINALTQSRVAAPAPAGALLMRNYSGFPPQGSGSSGGYTASTVMAPIDPVAPHNATPARNPLVFLIDGALANFLPTLAALQTAGAARIVSEGDVGAGVMPISFGSSQALMSRGVYVYPEGVVGFQPDALAPPDDEAAGLRIAIAHLTATASTRTSATRPVRSPPRAYQRPGVPSVEQRLLALYRLWGTIEYFYPYKALLDRPWSDTLAEFIPIFIAASTREAYETALLRLSARTQDTHSGFVGLTATLYGAAPHRPGLYPRFVEGQLVVMQVTDQTIADRVAVGDEIVAVDGEPVSRIAARLTPLMAHSTPQALEYVLAGRIIAGPAGSQARLTLRSADGRSRTARIPRATPTLRTYDTPVWRMLDGNVGYINLERLSGADADRALDELIGARALIFDLRGYPQGTAWVIAPRLARRPDPIVAARFRRPEYNDPPFEAQEYWMTFEQPIPSQDGRAKFTGPIYVLIDDRAISQSEHTGLFFEAAADVTFVGSPTNGANGDVTTLFLPGSLQFRFTGHDVRWADGTQLQRRGIQPDIAVAPTIAGVRAGRDEVLEAALERARR